MKIKKAVKVPKMPKVQSFGCGGSVKKMADGGMVSCHNPDNKLPKHAMHTRGRNRGM